MTQEAQQSCSKVLIKDKLGSNTLETFLEAEKMVIGQEFTISMNPKKRKSLPWPAVLMASYYMWGYIVGEGPILHFSEQLMVATVG
jgi:hypothetical protein